MKLSEVMIQPSFDHIIGDLTGLNELLECAL